MAHIALCTSLYNPDWLKALCWATEQRWMNAGERSPFPAGYIRQTDLQWQTHWHIIQKQGKQPTAEIRMMTLWHQGCNGKGRKGTVAAPEMTGDLLNAALSWGSAFFIMNFDVFLSKKCPFTLVIPHEGTSGGGINSVALFQRWLLQVLSAVIPDTVSKLLKANSRTWH